MKTHRTILACATLCILLVPAFARAKPLGFGVKAGVNSSSLSGAYADAIDAKSQTGFVVGAFLTQDLTPYLGLQEEALFDAERTKSNDDAIKVDLNFVEVPVLLRFSLLPGPAKPFVYAGPSFKFRISGKVRESGQPDIDLKDRLQPVNTSAAAGAGVRLGLGGLGLIGDVRYTTSTQNILKSGDVLSVRDHTWTISAGVLF